MLLLLPCPPSFISFNALAGAFDFECQALLETGSVIVILLRLVTLRLLLLL